jgi:hypothetical protein
MSSVWESEIERGRRWIRTLEISVSGAPINLAGYTAVVRVGNLTLTSEEVTLDGDSVTLDVAKERTALLTGNAANIRVSLESGGGVPLPRIVGRAVLR